MTYYAYLEADEICLHIPYDERDRAKRIPNFRWDPDNKVWRYPASEFVLDALNEEFGPEELVIHGDRSQIEKKGPSPELMVISRFAVEALINTSDHMSEGIKRALSSESNMLAYWERTVKNGSKLSGRLQKFRDSAIAYGFPSSGGDEELINFIEAALSSNLDKVALISQLATLECEKKALRDELATRVETDNSTPERQVVQIAEQYLLDHAINSSVLSAVELNQQCAKELQIHLENILRDRLDVQRDKTTFDQLIREAFDARILDNEANAFAHTLRHQRNKFAHETVPNNQVTIRAAVCVLAYSFVVNSLERTDPAT